MNTRPHSHLCGICGKRVDCRNAREGGCIFSESTGATCEPCVAVRFEGLDRDEAEERYGHVCMCPIQMAPGQRCPKCNLWQLEHTPADPPRVLHSLIRRRGEIDW